MKIKNCLIRCDYNSKSGFGHLFRMLALAGELRKTYRWNIIFVISESSADDKFISSNNFEIIRINTDNSNSEKNCINRIINLNETNLIVFDIKTELKQTYLNSLQNRNIMVVTIDDSSERRLSSDLCFYPPVPQTSELDWRGFNGKIYHGADWILLREEFLSYENVEDKSKTLLHPKRILLTMGGSDPAGFTLLAIEALELITQDIDVDVLIGPSFLHQEKLKDLLRNCTKKIKIHKKIRQPADLMKKQIYQSPLLA